MRKFSMTVVLVFVLVCIVIMVLSNAIFSDQAMADKGVAAAEAILILGVGWMMFSNFYLTTKEHRISGDTNIRSAKAGVKSAVSAPARAWGSIEAVWMLILGIILLFLSIMSIVNGSAYPAVILFGLAAFSLFFGSKIMSALRRSAPQVSATRKS